MLFDSSLSYEDFLCKMKDIQCKFLLFIDDELNYEENFENLKNVVPNFLSTNNENEIKSFIYLLSKVAKNHFRKPYFFDKIKQILQHLKEYIKINYSNIEIFNFFKSSKIIILFLIDEKLLTIDKYVYDKMTNSKSITTKYHLYFQPELQNYIKTEQIYHDNDDHLKWIENLPEDFNEKRKIGENDNYVCKLIRDDLIDDFISFIYQNNLDLNSEIEQSIYETNSFLITKTPTLIEYAAFFGSYQILQYLYSQGVELTSSLWIYGLHGYNPDIIHFLEENLISPSDKSYEECLKEAIKCHHNIFVFNIYNHFLNEKVELYNLENDYDNNLFAYCFHYYNYNFFPDDLSNKFIFSYACQYDHLEIVKLILKTKKLDFENMCVQYNNFLFYTI